MGTRIKTVKFLRDPTDADKLAPQSKAIVTSAIAAYGVNTEMTVKDVVVAMTPNITTRQPMERIFGYYAPKLEEAGLISVERAAAAAVADGEKPKRKKKEKAAAAVADGEKPKRKKKEKAGEDVGGELSDEADED